MAVCWLWTFPASAARLAATRAGFLNWTLQRLADIHVDGESQRHRERANASRDPRRPSSTGHAAAKLAQQQRRNSSASHAASVGSRRSGNASVGSTAAVIDGGTIQALRATLELLASLMVGDESDISGFAEVCACGCMCELLSVSPSCTSLCSTLDFRRSCVDC